jgi:hypothetical protein
MYSSFRFCEYFVPIRNFREKKKDRIEYKPENQYRLITYNSEIVKVTDENVQKEIDINTEVLGIVISEIVKVTDE